MKKSLHHGGTESTEEEREKETIAWEEASMLELEDLTRSIIGAAIEVHRALGPGLLESTYRVCLCHELKSIGLGFQAELELPIIYKGARLETGYRIDLLVQENVILELKAIEKLLPIHEAQLLTYLRLAQKRVGLLINFNVPILKEGIIRRVL